MVEGHEKKPAQNILGVRVDANRKEKMILLPIMRALIAAFGLTQWEER